MRDEPSISLVEGLKRELAPVVGRLPAYTRLLAALYRDPSLSRRQRLWLAAGFVYSVSPVDLIPGFIPGLGQLDDLYAVLSSLARVLAGLPDEQRLAHLESAGLAPDALEEDMGRVRTSMRLLLGATLRGSGRAAVWAFRSAAALGGATFRAGRRALRGIRARRRAASGV